MYWYNLWEIEWVHFYQLYNLKKVEFPIDLDKGEVRMDIKSCSELIKW